jgi:hypothetical protein
LPGLTRQSIALEKMDARVKPGHDKGNRHCERSEAIHRVAKQVWIASSLRFSQ